VIKPPSLAKPFTEYFSEDPAFEQLASDATPEQTAEYSAKLTAAWETGDWSALRAEGAGEPTTFTVRALPSDAFGKLADIQAAGAGDNEVYQLAFRVVLQSVSNLGNAKVTTIEDERFGRIASLQFLTDAGVTGALGMRIMREIGVRALKRANDSSGK
jgi:hypothetical protein